VTSGAPPRSTAGRRKSRGIVLVIALIALIAMGFGAISLMRAVDATSSVVGNVVSRRAATLPPDAAVERAIAALFERHLIIDSNDDLAQNYFASRQSGEDARGVPIALQDIANFPRDAHVDDAGNGYSTRFVIERMCARAGSPSRDDCILIPVGDEPMAGGGPEPPRVPLFRQTIRVDGPAGTLLYVQAWLANLPDRRRLSWRTLAD